MNRLEVENRKCSFKTEGSYYEDTNTLSKVLNQVTGKFRSDSIKRTGIGTSFDKKVVFKRKIPKVTLVGQLKDLEKIWDLIELDQEILAIAKGWEIPLL